MTALGNKNNNPWNVKCENKNNPWKGTSGYDSVGHVQFHHVIFAIRATCRDIAAKYLGGRKSILEIMERYSNKNDTLGSIPGKEHNDPVSAAKFIAHQMGDVDMYEDVDLFSANGKPKSVDRLCRFLEALYHQECGWTTKPPSRIMLLAGIEEYEKDFVKE